MLNNYPSKHSFISTDLTFSTQSNTPSPSSAPVLGLPYFAPLFNLNAYL